MTDDLKVAGSEPLIVEGELLTAEPIVDPDLVRRAVTALERIAEALGHLESTLPRRLTSIEMAIDAERRTP